MSTALPPPTPEDVAVLTSDALHIYGWDLSQDGSVVKIGIGPFGDDDKPLLPEIHFRAVVVEGDQTPIVLERPASLVQEWQVGETYGARSWISPDRFVCVQVVGAEVSYLSPADARRLAARIAALADNAERLAADQGEAETR